MGDQLEKTAVAQAHHDRVTGEIPITVSDSQRLDMFTDNTPLTCGIEDPDICESCQ